MDFSFYPLRFRFQARDTLYFPPGKSTNILRGGFGLMLRKHAPVEVYRRIFEPIGHGPSGLRDLPRPFVLRASALDGKRLAPGESFHFDLNLFDTQIESVLAIQQAFEALGQEGFGPGRGKADLQQLAEPVLITIPLAGNSELGGVRIDFVTPLELKAQGEVTELRDFQVLFSRIRDRISSLRCLYGPGALDIDFKEMGRRAGEVRLTGGEWKPARRARRSSRTGQVHEIGGFTGWATYAGQLGEFLPYLNAAEYCGVGRQCVWGKGEIRVAVTECK